jgi:hypothetical protein
VEIKTAMSMICATFELLKVQDASAVKELFSFSMMPEGLRIGLKARSTREPVGI